MALNESNQIVTLKAEVAELKAQNDKGADILIKFQRRIEALTANRDLWMTYAKSLETQLQTNAQQRTAAPPEFDWDPPIGAPGFSFDGKHDMGTYRKHCAEQRRIREEIAQRQAVVANERAHGEHYEWPAAPGDPGFNWSKEAAT